jgi:autotransporter-associated beta strand protein
LPGNTPGGGGSGGAVKGAANTTFTAVGGNGGAGQIILTYSFTPSTFVKADNQANLNNGNSYVGSVAPDPYTTVTFNNTLQTYGTFSLGGNFAWGGIVVSNPASAIIIANDGNTLTNGATGIDMSQATVNMTLSNQMVLAANQTWNVTNTKTLLVAGQVTGNNTITATGGGTIQLGAANVLPGGASLALNAGTLDLNTFSQTINNLNGSSVIDTVAGGTPSLTVTNGTFSGNLQNTAGSLSLIMAGAGNTLFLSGSNSFIGTTTILAGTLQLGNVNALQNCSGVSMAGGTVLQSTLDGVTIAAPITAGFAGTTVTINAPTNNPGNQGFDMLILDGAIGGAGNLIFSSVLNVNTINTVLLGAQSTYGGNTLLTTTGGTASQAFIRLGTNNALPATTVLTLDGGTGAGSGRFVDLNLNGFNQTLAGLTNTARALRVQRVVNSDVSAYATLTISNNSDVNFGYNSGANSGGYLGSSAANGSVNPTAMPGATGGNNFGLTKSGSGTFTLVSPSTYTGNTVINAGSLALGGSGAISGTPNIIVGNGATFDVSGLASAFTLGGSQTLSNNAASTGNLKGSLATATGAVSVNFSSGTPAFAVTAGTLTLSNTTTFKVNNTGSALAGGSYTIITNNGGSVAVVGALPAVTVIGGGIVSGATVALATNSMGLQLVVTSSQGPNYLQIKSPQIINGQQVMTFYGTAGNGYALDWTTNLNAPVVWSAIITNIASGDGSTLFTNSMAQPIAFYRVRQVSP